MAHSKWILQKLKDLVQEDKDLKPNATKLIGTTLIALSGLLLYLDKAFAFYSITVGIPEKFESIGWDQQTFIWFMMQTLTPLLLIIGAWFKPYKITYIIPLYCYLLQLYFVLFDYKIIDDNYIGLYTLGSTLLVILTIEFIKYISKLYLKNQIKKEKSKLLNGV